MNPLTALYGAVTRWRNTLYDQGRLSSRRLARPVISVGNLSTGGSGKTPFVIALGRLLQEHSIAFDVLTRGYGRKTRGVLLAQPDGNAFEFGDEPLLIARKLGVPVIVGESRYAAGVFAEKNFHSQLHILDDGFQHRSLARDLDIALLSQADLNDKLLPSGRLREPLSSLKRADAIVLAKDLPGANAAIVDFNQGGKPIWKICREISIPPDVHSPIVFCGIARPQQFFDQVRAAGITPAAEIAFRDHRAYNESDVKRLLAQRKQFKAAGFLTTEKDAVNLRRWIGELQPLSFAVLKVTIDQPQAVFDAISAVLAKRKPRS
jgi:tetraacyldisaccharide 4'-kinase